MAAATFKFCFAVEEDNDRVQGPATPTDSNDTTYTLSADEKDTRKRSTAHVQHGMLKRRDLEEHLLGRLCAPDYTEEVVRFGGNLPDATLLERKDFVCESNSALQKASRERSDLLPGEYEGGLKVWECSLDLVRFVFQERRLFEGKRVLELGCGVGLPGMAALQNGASHVTFQDYNRSVLLSKTVPTVLANLEQAREGRTREELLKLCSFCYGSWDGLCEDCGEDMKGSFDVILTSETIYNLDSYSSLLKAFKHFLKEEGGVILLAAKSYYFGVGGSVAGFKECLLKDGHFVVHSELELGRDTVHRVILTMTTHNDGNNTR